MKIFRKPKSTFKMTVPYVSIFVPFAAERYKLFFVVLVDAVVAYGITERSAPVSIRYFKFVCLSFIKRRLVLANGPVLAVATEGLISFFGWYCYYYLI